MTDASINTTSTKKKKKGIFKSIARGLSIKKKKKHIDDESVVGVAFERSNGAPAPPGNVGGKSAALAADIHPYKPVDTSTASTSTSPPIQVVLLLMDPASRRFELLQLEFDSNKALVSDVLHQIEQSATEQLLRDKKYAGVCDVEGVEMIQSMKLARFCEGNDVVMAMPKGMSGGETAILARPILGDPKVVEMVRVAVRCLVLCVGVTSSWWWVYQQCVVLLTSPSYIFSPIASSLRN